MLNYHELTINEPRDSPAKRKQFLVICTIMAAVLAHALTNAGAFSPVQIDRGAFPGGEMVFKPMTRDYPAFLGLTRTVGKDLGISESEWDDTIYSVFLDVDPDSNVPGGHTRFVSGALIGKGGGTPDMKETLLAWNEGMKEVSPDVSDLGDLNDRDKFGGFIKYEAGNLPKAEAAVSQFVYTNGFVSALVHQYKVYPALVKYAKEHADKGSPIVIIATCSIQQQMCTLYAPLQKGSKFYSGLGKPDSASFAATVQEKSLFDFGGISMLFGNLFGFKSSSTEDNEL